MGWLHYFFGFSGRINRSLYWGFAAPFGLFVVALTLPLNILPSSYVETLTPLSESAVVFVATTLLVGFYAHLAIATKRLHDRDKSAWWLVVFILLPTAFSVVDSPLSVVGALVSIWGFIEFCVLRGTAGPNRFGPDPIATEDPAAAFT